MSATDFQLRGWIKRLRQSRTGLDCIGRQFPSIAKSCDMLNDLEIDMNASLEPPHVESPRVPKATKKLKAQDDLKGGI